MVPILSNETNHSLWPAVISQDVVRHTGMLSVSTVIPHYHFLFKEDACMSKFYILIILTALKHLIFGYESGTK